MSDGETTMEKNGKCIRCDYGVAFGIKMTGEDDYREMPLKAISREIKFRQDVMRK